MGVTKCFDSRPRSAYGESVAPHGSDASIRSKRRDEPRYDYGLLIRSSGPTVIEIGNGGSSVLLGAATSGIRRYYAAGNAVSGVGRRAQAVATQ